jgi:hypothetical protein
MQLETFGYWVFGFWSQKQEMIHVQPIVLLTNCPNLPEKCLFVDLGNLCVNSGLID